MAQLVEQLIRNQQVTGSNPVTSSRQNPLKFQRFEGLFNLVYAVNEYVKIWTGKGADVSADINSIL